MRIGEVARKTGIRPSAIRFYEQVGLLPVPSRKDGQRRYTVDVEDRLAIIEFARTAEFAVAEIKILFHGFEKGIAASARWQQLAQRKLGEIDVVVTRLRGMQRLLDAIMRCRCTNLSDCGRMLRWHKKNGSSGKRVGKNEDVMLLRGLFWQGFVCMQGVENFGTIPRCPSHAPHGGLPIRTASPDFVRSRPSTGYSVIREHASYASPGGGKNALRGVRNNPLQLVRPSYSSSARLAQWRDARVPRGRGASGGLPALPGREARATGLPR